MKRSVLLVLGAAALAACGPARRDGEAQRSPSTAKPALGGAYNDIVCGYLDFDAYCKWNYGPSSTAVLGSATDASSWRCKVDGSLRTITYDDLCLQQCGNPSIAMLADPTDPYEGWLCTDTHTPSCDPGDGSEWMTLDDVEPSGARGAAGYEVIGETSPWMMHIHANQFATEGNNIHALPGTFDGTPFVTWVYQGDNQTSTGAGLITNSSPLQHAISLSTPCGTRTWQTRTLTRVWPTAAPTGSVSVSSTYVNSGDAVTLNVQLQNVPVTACASSSLVRIVGKQPYDGAVVFDLTFSGDTFVQKSFTVHPSITTEYSATWYCTLDPTIRTTAQKTVTVYGPPLTQCPGNATPPTFWFCRDCPYNTPPLTNTIVQTACTYDQALQLAEQTTFGGACNLADGQCPSCPNPASCPGN